MEYGLLKDVIILFGLSIVVIFLFHRAKIPAIIGFLLTGILAGPSVLKLVTDMHDIEVLAEMGVILLLFTIGIEFSLKKLLEIKKLVLIGGSLQVFLTGALAMFIVWQFDFSITEAIFIGFLVSLSSTAIVLKLMQDKGEVVTLHGKIVLGILIFQDIIIVPMILVTPLLAGGEGSIGAELLYMGLKLAGVALFMIVFSKWVIPWLLYNIAKTQSRELFLLTIIVLGFAVAFLTYSIGLSLALGAFIGGLIISESDYSEQAFGNIIPFRDVFTSFFFVSVGMLLDLNYIFENPVIVLVVTLGVLIAKTFISGFVTFVMGYPFRTTVLVGLSLSQIGEFSFILSKIGIDNGIFSKDAYQLFLSVTVLTIAVTPFILNAAPRLAHLLLTLPLPKKLRCGLQNIPEIEEVSHLKDHLIIIGYGVNGKNVARAAKYASIPHVIIELNPETVKTELDKGETIFYGDSTQKEILDHAGIKKALILVVTIPGPNDARAITSLARSLNPNIHIIIRTRFIQDMETLFNLGADEVIPEEFETSVEIFTRVLAKYLVPREEIEKLVNQVRSDGYEVFRSLSISDGNYANLKVTTPQIDINSLHVCAGSQASGKAVNEIGLQKHGLSLLALSRKDSVFSNFRENLVLEDNDILFVLGSKANLQNIIHLFANEEICGTTE